MLPPPLTTQNFLSFCTTNYDTAVEAAASGERQSRDRSEYTPQIDALAAFRVTNGRRGAGEVRLE